MCAVFATERLERMYILSGQNNEIVNEISDECRNDSSNLNGTVSSQKTDEHKNISSNLNGTISSQTTDDLITDECQKGWKKYGDNCYFFDIKRKPWDLASQYCQDQGGHLTSIIDQEENYFINSEWVFFCF